MVRLTARPRRDLPTSVRFDTRTREQLRQIALREEVSDSAALRRLIHQEALRLGITVTDSPPSNP